MFLQFHGLSHRQFVEVENDPVEDTSETQNKLMLNFMKWEYKNRIRRKIWGKKGIIHYLQKIGILYARFQEVRVRKSDSP